VPPGVWSHFFSQGTEIGGAISHGACCRVLFTKRWTFFKNNVPTCLDQGPCPIPRSNKAANLQQTSRTNWGTWLSSGYKRRSILQIIGCWKILKICSECRYLSPGINAAGHHDTRPKVLLESWPFLRRRGQLWRTWNQWLPVPWWRTMMKNIYKGFGVYLWDKFTVFCQNEMEKSSQQEWQAPWWFSNALGTRSVRKNVRFSGL
jgi:hypothetical protein